VTSVGKVFHIFAAVTGKAVVAAVNDVTLTFCVLIHGEPRRAIILAYNYSPDSLFLTSVVFDTIEYSILLERLSFWFGISSTVLSWIKSYLLNRSFYVNNVNSSHLYSNSFMEFVEDRPTSLVLYSSSYTPLLSVLSYLIQQQTTNAMLMIINFSYLF